MPVSGTNSNLVLYSDCKLNKMYGADYSRPYLRNTSDLHNRMFRVVLACEELFFVTYFRSAVYIAGIYIGN